MPITQLPPNERATERWRKSTFIQRAYTLVGVLGIAIAALKLVGCDLTDDLVRGIRPQEDLGVTKVEYNFTPYSIEYQLGDKYRGDVEFFQEGGGGANGAKRTCCYKPGPAGEPLRIRWRYVSGEYHGLNNGYHFEAVVKQPQRSPQQDTLTIRFYPGGRVALRYTDTPETGGFGNVDPALPGSGWVEGQATELPGLRDKTRSEGTK